MDEFERIKSFFAPLAGLEALGLEDDAAVFEAPLGETLVFTKDMLVEGVHVPNGCAPAVFARRALRTNLSDIAAMGARPLGYLLGIALPDQIDDVWVEQFAATLAQDQRDYAVSLWGGDSVRTAEAVTISITMIGSAPQSCILQRSGAGENDDLYVSGSIGQAGAGLTMALHETNEGEAAWLDAYTAPQPRLALGQALRGVATACADVSDGLIADAAHIAYASDLRAHLILADIPTDAGLPLDKLAAASAGDDYELVFTAPRDKRDSIFTLSETLGVKVTRIGYMAPATFGAGVPGIDVLDANGNALKVLREGWRHRS